MSRELILKESVSGRGSHKGPCGEKDKSASWPGETISTDYIQ